MKHSWILASAFVLGIYSGGASAATVLNTASASGGGGGDPVCGDSTGERNTATDEEATATYLGSDVGCAAVGEATAGSGLVSAVSTVISTPDVDRGYSGVARSHASFNASSLHFTPDEGYTDAILSNLYGDTIEVTLFATFSGETSARTDPSTTFTMGAGGTIEANVRFGSASWTRSGSSGATSDTGAANLYDIDTFAESVSLTQAIKWQNSGSRVMMAIGTRAATSGVQRNSSAEGLADGSHTLSFPADGPVFLLPEGFTVFAPALNIYDNRWIDPRVDPDPDPDPDVASATAPVPLSAITWLLLAGLIMLAANRNFRGRR